MKATEAMAVGVVDSVHESPEATVEAAVRLGEELVKRKWDGEVYSDIRLAMYPSYVASWDWPPRAFEDWPARTC
ncbi:hypothetical protein C3L33_15048, partial [Rhododendron williamsianum]